MKFLRFLLLFLVFNALKAKDNSFGINLSTYSGMGLSYQSNLNKNISYKITGFGYYFGDNPPDEMTILANLGLEIQYNLTENEIDRTYLLIGTSFWKKEDRSVDIVKLNDEIIVNKIRRNYNIFNLGIGMGYDYKIYGPVKFNCNLGLQYQSSSAPNLGILIDLNPNGQNYIGPAGSLGFQVSF